jgi:hypothetical protein
LIEEVEAFGGPETRIDQVLCTEYEAGVGIGWHRDKPHFGRIFGVSLGSLCRLRFRRQAGDTWERRALDVAPRARGLLHLSADGPCTPNKNASSDKPGNEIAKPSAERDADQTEQSAGNGGANDTQKDIHKDSSVALHKIRSDPPGYPANYNGRDPPNTRVVHSVISVSFLACSSETPRTVIDRLGSMFAKGGAGQ